jgi:hypothetical protein
VETSGSSGGDTEHETPSRDRERPARPPGGCSFYMGIYMGIGIGIGGFARRCEDSDRCAPSPRVRAGHDALSNLSRLQACLVPPAGRPATLRAPRHSAASGRERSRPNPRESAGLPDGFHISEKSVPFPDRFTNKKSVFSDTYRKAVTGHRTCADQGYFGSIRGACILARGAVDKGCGPRVVPPAN